MKKMKKILIVSEVLILTIFFGLSFIINTAQAQSTTLTPYQQLQAQQGIAPAQEIQLDTTPSSGTIPYIQAPTYTIPIRTFCVTTTGLENIICQTQLILSSIVPLLLSLGVVYFIWNVVRYVIADGEEAKKKGKDGIIYGIIGLAVITGLWGLVTLITNTFGLSGTSAPTLSTTGQSAGCSAIISSSTIQNLLCYITGIINNAIIPLIFALAVAMFVWGVVNFFIINADEEAKRNQGKQFMIWGIIALAVMLSIWGLVGILGSTFGISSNVLPHVTPPN